MVSSIADWVLGVARLISSARQICVKIGPFWNSKNRLPSGVSMTMFVPRMSAGMRSGVNWMREKSRSSAWARVRTRSVLPSPGTPSKQTMPAHEQAGQYPVDDLLVTDDHPGDLLGGPPHSGPRIPGPVVPGSRQYSSCVPLVGQIRSTKYEIRSKLCARSRIREILPRTAVRSVLAQNSHEFCHTSSATPLLLHLFCYASSTTSVIIPS